MVVIIVILTVAIFLVVDLVLRLALEKRQTANLLREREEALDIGLKLDFAEEAPSLKRVDVENPKARILAVDDEPVVLDSFRKILVLEGYSIDTVETAQEGLGLVRKRDYDFVFTDLKMPGMDGLDLTKAVKHLRPDIDVVMITGYATIESAVETMKHGAMDYVEKPFTADELAQFTRKLVIRRQDRIEKLTPPTVHLVTPSSGQSRAPNVVNVPGGLYVSPEHTWVGIEVTGEARIGLDDFAVKTLRDVEEIEFPESGNKVSKGDPLFTIKRRGQSLTISSPLDGTVSRVNHELAYHLELLARRPYEMGWICSLVPGNLSADLGSMRIGADAISWFESEIENFQHHLKAARQTQGEGEADDEGIDELAWSVFAATFLTPAEVPAMP
ncbi:MAG: response regulator [Thermoanaerobaculia bacterium]